MTDAPTRSLRQCHCFPKRAAVGFVTAEAVEQSLIWHWNALYCVMGSREFPDPRVSLHVPDSIQGVIESQPTPNDLGNSSYNDYANSSGDYRESVDPVSSGISWKA